MAEDDYRETAAVDSRGWTGERPHAPPPRVQPMEKWSTRATLLFWQAIGIWALHIVAKGLTTGTVMLKHGIVSHAEHPAHFVFVITFWSAVAGMWLMSLLGLLWSGDARATIARMWRDGG